jgi:hypothetical protein
MYTLSVHLGADAGCQTIFADDVTIDRRRIDVLIGLASDVVLDRPEEDVVAM